MNISYNWLKELIDIDLTAGQTADELTRIGHAVEGIERVGDDYVFDVDLTSNRSDCLSHYGIARELAVVTGGRLKEQNFSIDKSVSPDAIPFPAVLAPEIVKIDAPDLCHRFTARIIRNVKIGPSPEWLVKRLEAVGERSINNVADITNFVMHELGQPMHAFDLDKLAGQRIIVRRARPDETIKTLDEVERKLTHYMLAICDAEKPIAVAGVMGGYDSGITEQTFNVLLEVAYFDRENIRKTSRTLGLATEASYRFERGVDIQNLMLASDRASELIKELAGGTVEDIVDIFPTRPTPKCIECESVSTAVKRLSGLDIDENKCREILAGLGISAPDFVGSTFTAPSWRHDISIEADLVEEVVRIYGYENIAQELPAAFGSGEYQPNELTKKSIRRTLNALGFDEALSYSFIDKGLDEMTTPVIPIGEEGFVELQDSVIDGAVRMRPSLIPGLLAAIKTNFNHQRRDLKLFEIGKVFAAGDSETELPNETECIAFVLTGTEKMQDRLAAGKKIDFYDLKGIVEVICDAADVSGALFYQADVVHLTKGQAAALVINGRNIGYFGRVSDEIKERFKFKQDVFAGEIDLDALLGGERSVPVYEPLPRFPGISRDVSLIISKKAGYGSIRSVILDKQRPFLDDVSFVDIYEGKGIDETQRSLTIRIDYRKPDGTLTEDEIAPIHEELLKDLRNDTGAELRY